MRTILLFCLLLLLNQSQIFAQNLTNCGTDEIIKNNPELKKQIEKKILNIQNSPNVADPNTVFVIPVVFVINHLGEPIGSGSNKPDSYITTVLNDINQAYRKQGIYSNGNDVKIQFQLAQYDSQCNSSTGIVRINASNVPNYAQNGLNVNDNTMQNQLRALTPTWNSEDCIIIRLVHSMVYYGGYSYFWNDMFVVSGVNGSLYSHELGHSFSLLHTFQSNDNGNTCSPNNDPNNQGDYISDTDPHLISDDCQFRNSTDINSCTNSPFGNILKNHMSYSSPYCIDRFTVLQIERMRNGLVIYRPKWINSKCLTGQILQPIANSSSRCFTGSITLTASGCSGTYNWFAGNVGGNPLSSGSTFTSPTISATTTYYVSCNEGNCTSVRTPVQAIINTSLSLSCYCNEAIKSTYSDYMDITNITIGNLNNTSTCLTTGTMGSIQNIYSNYTNLTPVNFTRGSTNNVNIQTSNCNGNQGGYSIKVFIDFNKNGIFSDAGEAFFIASNISSSSPTGLGSISIPNNAILGNTFMRVVLGQGWDIDSDGSCGNIYWGETEDYKINIIQTCVLPTATLTGTQTITAGQSANLSVAFTAIAPWSIVMNGTAYTASSSPLSISVSPTTTTTYNISNLSNSCGAGTFSGSAVITVNACTQMYTLKTGNWNDITVWSCNRIPTSVDIITVKTNHFITIPASYTANAKNVIFEAVGGKFIYAANTSKLCLSCPTITTNGLVLYLPMDGNANDASGNNNNGVVTGATLGNDRFGVANKAYRFNDGNRISVTNTASLALTNAFTFSIWVNMQSNTGRDGNGVVSTTPQQCLFTKNCDNGQIRSSISPQSNGTYILQTYANAGDQLAIPFQLNQWKHIVSTYDGTTLKQFVNGSLVSTKTVALSLALSNSYNLVIGNMGCYVYYFNGFMDEFRMYNRALSDTEVTTIYNAEK